MNGKSDLIIMAGPCSVESKEQIRRIAEAVKLVDGQYLRGGAFKPRTEAGEWTGHGEIALEWMRRVADEFELKIVTEILDKSYISMFQEYDVDLFQVGARNAQNQELLFALGEANVPVLLKNGMNTTFREWLGSAGKAGDESTVMLCARGKNNETDVARNGQDIATLVELVDNTSYKILFDPSHITGKRELVYGATIGAIATGVDGIIVEVHNDPLIARTDGRQSITPKQLEYLVRASHLQRQSYLEQSKIRNKFAAAQVPKHVDIYFRVDDSKYVSKLIEGLSTRPYSNEETGILTSRIPSGWMSKFREGGCAIAETTNYKYRGEDYSAEGARITLPNGDRIKMTPFNEASLNFRGGKPSNWEGKRVELAHGFPGQTIRDIYLTVDMGKVEELTMPLILYKPVKG